MYTITIDNVTYAFVSIEKVHEIASLPEDNLSDSMRAYKDAAIQLGHHLYEQQVYSVLCTLPEDCWNTFYF